MPALRADPAIIARNQRGQSGLWAYAISGDLPIVLLQIRDAANIDLARQLVQAHAYWRLKGLVVDLVIWCEDQSGYRQALQDQIMSMIASGMDAQSLDRPGGVFVRLLDQIPNEDRILMQSVARVRAVRRAAASWPTSCAAPPCAQDRAAAVLLTRRAFDAAAAPPLAVPERFSTTASAASARTGANT
jgi:hypothetical protein